MTEDQTQEKKPRKGGRVIGLRVSDRVYEDFRLVAKARGMRLRNGHPALAALLRTMSAGTISEEASRLRRDLNIPEA